MRIFIAALIATATLVSGCASRRYMSDEEASQVYVGSAFVVEHWEGTLVKADTIDPNAKITTTDAVGTGLVANSGGVLKGVGAAMNVASFLASSTGGETYVLHLDDNGKEVQTKAIGPIKPRKFEVGHKYRVFILKNGEFLFLDLTKLPTWDEKTRARTVSSAAQ